MRSIIFIPFLSSLAFCSSTSSCEEGQLQTGSQIGAPMPNVTNPIGQLSSETPGPLKATFQIQIGNLSGSGVVELTNFNPTQIWLGPDTNTSSTSSALTPEQTETLNSTTSPTSSLYNPETKTVRFANNTVASNSTSNSTGFLAPPSPAPTLPSLFSSGGVSPEIIRPLIILPPVLLQLAFVYLT